MESDDLASKIESGSKIERNQKTWGSKMLGNKIQLGSSIQKESEELGSKIELVSEITRISLKENKKIAEYG